MERAIPPQTVDVGETVELHIRLSFYDRDQRALDYSVESADPSVASASTDDRELTLTVRLAKRRNETASQTVAVTVLGPALLAYEPSASDPVLEGFVRVINRSVEATPPA